MRKRMTIVLGGAATLLWLCGLLLTGFQAQAQTTTDQTEKTTKSKKKKKSAKSTAKESSATESSATESSPQAAAPAETGEKKTKAKKGKTQAETNAQAEETTKPKKHKKSATEVPSQSFVPPGTAGGKAEESAPPVGNASKAQVQSAKANGMVWVNTDSGIYHKGGRWYGATKQGKFMTEDEAVRAGYRAAQNEK